MDTRGVFGSRASKLGGSPSAPAGRTATPGVRAPKIKSGGEQLNRGVIRGAKGPGASGRTDGGFGAGRGSARKKDREKAKYLGEATEDSLFNVDQTVVPGVIRGWTPPAEQEHTAGPAFGERPGKVQRRKDSKFDFDDDDW